MSKSRKGNDKMKNQLTQGIKQMYEEAGQIGHTGMRRLLLDVQAALDAQDAEIAALKADRAEAWRELAATQDRENALRKDAERYRWLRDKNTGDATVYEVTHDDGNLLRHSEELDTAIDAALAQAVQPTLICLTCKADRLKEDCKGVRSDCGLKVVAQAAQA